MTVKELLQNFYPYGLYTLKIYKAVDFENLDFKKGVIVQNEILEIRETTPSMTLKEYYSVRTKHDNSEVESWGVSMVPENRFELYIYVKQCPQNN